MKNNFLGSKEGFLRLTKECLRHPWRLSLAFGALLCLAGTRLYLTWLVKLFTEGPLEHGNVAAFKEMLFGGTVAILAMAASILVSQYLLIDVNQRVVKSIRDSVQNRLLAMGVGGVRRFRSGDLVSRLLSDAWELSSFVQGVLERLLGEGLVAAGSVFMMFYLSWKLALATCLVVVVAGALLGSMTRMIRRWADRSRKSQGALGAVFSEQISGVATIKGFQAEQFETLRFQRCNETFRTQFMRCQFWSAVFMSWMWLVTGLGFLAIVFYGGMQIISGEMTRGAMLAFCLYAAQTVEPVRKFSNINADLQRILAAASRVFEIADEEETEPDGSLPLAAPVAGALLFDGVKFSYDEETDVLKGASFSAQPGEPIAVVSSSGGGKSTIGRLIARFLEPREGRIALDGADIGDLRLSEYRKAVCLVEQEPFIFGGTLLDNIRYGSWDASLETVEKAVELAGLTSFLKGLPQGLETNLTEAGRNLSGGQKQRIALARAIVRNPRVLVLDEATSALDSETEARVFARLDPWLRQRTVLLMAHRLATVYQTDRIVVLEHGRVAGDGPPEAVLQSCEAFRKLFEEQFEPGAMKTAVFRN